MTYPSMFSPIQSRRFFLGRFALALAVVWFANPSHGSETDNHAALWQAVASGSHVAIIRHALAPGFGDPAEFELENCSTQRNLSAVGRDQARRIGDLFRQNGISQAQVMTSQWCRCRETAKLMSLGDPADLPPLNSFFQERSRGPEQNRALQQWLHERQLRLPLVLVTHQVNITALTGLGASSGEIVVFQIKDNNAVEVLGRIDTLSD